MSFSRALSSKTTLLFQDRSTGCSSQNQECGDPLRKYSLADSVTPVEGILCLDLGSLPLPSSLSQQLQVGGNKSECVCGGGEGSISSGFHKALGYPDRDHVSVTLGWPAATPYRGDNTVNCTKLLMQPKAMSEKSPEVLRWSHVGGYLIA